MNLYKQIRQQSDKTHNETYLPNYKPNKITTGYLISLQGVKEFSLEDTPFGKNNGGNIAEAKYYIQYNATLYNYKLNSRGGFYGKTYTSQPKILTMSPQNTSILEVKDEEFIYFHTNYAEKTSVLVVELVLIRELSDKSKTLASGGFATCPIFEFG